MSELALKLIAENKETRATFLDLGNCGLTKVPDEIGELVWLEELSFAGRWWNGKQRYESQNMEKANNISLLGRGFHRLKKLKKLWLNGNRELTDLSPLTYLTSLQLLNLGGVQVYDLSPLVYLTNLQLLLISNTQVSDLSPLAYLTRLQLLDVSNTYVSDLHPLANLNSLQSLKVSSSKVFDLSALTNLSSLQRLNVSNSPVSDLSPLAALSSLQMLYVADTAVYDLTPLATLSSLQLLQVFNTTISDLTPIAALSSLQKLYVSNTAVYDISPLVNLSNLQILSIHHTAVADLSTLLPLIENGLATKWSSDGKSNGIYVEDCPLSNPPVAIVQQGNEAILNYFREKKMQGMDYLYEAKLLLVGEGGAGKTSLLRCLYQTEKALPDETDSTKGIEIYRHEFKLSNGRVFRLNVWDFGGQEIYHATHQFFLTQRSLYVLLDDTRKDHKTVHDEQFKYWLEAVDLLSGHSPVLIFQNEKSGRSKDIDFAGIKGKFDNVKERYSGDLLDAHASDKLKLAIEFFAQNLPHIGEELPAQWIPIRADIEQRASEQATMSVQEYFALYEKRLPFDEQKALWLSQYLHDLGVFLHYQDHELLRRIVILQNDWATEAVFALLDDEQVKKQLGRFTASDCQRLWREARYAGLDLELRALMEKFELCYELRDSQPKAWLAPQLLPPSKPTELTGWEQVGDLILRYRYEFLPKGMINRLMVRQHRFVPRPDTAWLTGVLFERDGTQVLVEISAKGGEIQLRARGIERKELLSVIASDLDALNETFKGLPEKVVKLIPCCCPRCSKQSEPEFFAQQRLLQRKKDGKLTIECPSSYADVSVLELLDGVQMNKLPNWSKEETIMEEAMKIFISYSKHDERYKKALLEHLSSLRNRIITWNDDGILPGEKWDARIKEELHKADVVLYLVSAKSMSTNYIQRDELPLIKQRCDDGKCKLVPIIVKPCDWKEEDFSQYGALPRKGKAITTWTNKDSAWLDVVEGIKRILNASTSEKLT